VASLVNLDLGEFARAKAQAKTALAQNPAAPEALVARATVALVQHEPAAAVRWLTRALHADPQDARTWATLALAHLQAEEPALARAQFSHVTRLLPAHVRVWLGLGWACVLLRDRVGALPAFRQGLALDGEQAEGHACVGLVLQLTGRAAEAEQSLARAEQIDPGNPTARHARALQGGQREDASVLRGLAGRLLQPPGFG
jgi:Flp pilus assembly protein TadD